MALRPPRDFILVSPIKNASKTASGLLYTPENVDPKVMTAKVMAVGSGRITDNGTLVPMEAKVDDTILFSKSSSVEVDHNGEKLNLLREDSILSFVV
jgi:chaperonin GroES